MKFKVKKSGNELLPWVVEDDSGSVAWCGSWKDAVKAAYEYSSEMTVSLVKPDRFFCEHHWSYDHGRYECDVAVFGDVEASKPEGGFYPACIRLWDCEFSSLTEARRTVVQLLSACAWLQHSAAAGEKF